MGNQGAFPFASSDYSSSSYNEQLYSKLSQRYNFNQASLPYIEDKKNGRKYVTYQYTTNFNRQAQLLEQSLQMLTNFPNPNISGIKQYFRSQQNSYCTQKDMFLIVYNNPQPYRLEKEYQMRKNNNKSFSADEIIKIIEAVLSGLWFFTRELPMSQSQHDIFASRFIQLDMNTIAIDKNPPEQQNLNRIYLIDPWLQDIIGPKSHRNRYQAPQKAYIQRQDKMSSYNQFQANLYILGLIGLQLYFMKPMQKIQGNNTQLLDKITIDRYLNTILKQNQNPESIKLKEGLSILLQSNPKKRQQIYYAWKFSTKDIKFLNNSIRSQQYLLRNENQQVLRNRSYSQPFPHQIQNQLKQFTNQTQRNTVEDMNNINNYQVNYFHPQKIRTSQYYPKQLSRTSQHIIQQQSKKDFTFIKQQPKVFRQPSFHATNKPYFAYKNKLQNSIFNHNIKNSIVKFNKLPDIGITTSIVPSNQRSQQRSYVNHGGSSLATNTNFQIRFNSNNQPINKTINRVNSVGHYSNIPQSNQLVTSFMISEQNKVNNIVNNRINKNLSQPYEQSFEATLNQLKKLQGDINLLSSKIKNQLNQSQFKVKKYTMASQSRTYQPIQTKVERKSQTKQEINNFQFLKQDDKRQQIVNFKPVQMPNYNFSNLPNVTQQKTQKKNELREDKNEEKQVIVQAKAPQIQSQIKLISYQEYHIADINKQKQGINKPFNQITQKQQSHVDKSPQTIDYINNYQKIYQIPENVNKSPSNQFKNLSSKHDQKTNVKPIEHLLLENKLKSKQKTEEQIKMQNLLLEQLWTQNKPQKQQKQKIMNKTEQDPRNTQQYSYFDKNQIADSMIVRSEMEEQKTQQVQSFKFMEDNSKNLNNEMSLQQKKSQYEIDNDQEQQNLEKRNSGIDGLQASPISQINTDFDDKSMKFLKQTEKYDSNYFHKRRLSPNGIIFQAYQQNSSTSSRKRTPEKKQDLNDSSSQSDYVCQQYQSGSRYEGFKKNGMRNGRGKFSYQDGGYYEGEWKDNKMHGWGKLFYENGKIAYEGYWLNDQFHGFGKVYNDSPAPLNTPFDYQNFDKLEDYWVYYEGSLVNDTKQGKGRIMLTNNERFQGDFHADRIQGYGKYWKMDGTVVQGIWKDSELIKLLSK